MKCRYEGVITKTKLEDLLLCKKLSLFKIAELFGCDRATLRTYCDKYDVHLPKDLSGLTINSWQVVSKTKDKYNHTKYVCRCSCGYTKLISFTVLWRGKSTRCKKCFFKSLRERDTEFIVKKFFFGGIRLRAEKRKLEFNLTREYLSNLFVQQDERCALSGIKIKLPGCSKAYHSKESDASLDRIDSSKGYVVGNVHWIHKKINMMKFNYPLDTFISFCAAITEHAKNGRAKLS